MAIWILSSDDSVFRIGDAFHANVNVTVYVPEFQIFSDLACFFNHQKIR